MAEQKAQLDWSVIKKFSAQVSGDIGSAMLGAMSYIGDRLGIFRALADAGSVTSAGLAERTGLSERYLREWLSAMAAAGYVNYDVAAKTYAMPAEHAMVLARDDSPFFAGGFIEMIVPQMSIAPKVMESFKNGRGVPQSEYPAETWEAMERSSAAMYRHSLVRKWLPAMPQVVEKLSAGGSSLDVGCGAGRAAIAIATAFPRAKVFGFDAHAGSLERARANARAAGLADRITFDVVDCTKLPTAQFDFISTFDVVHDSVDPDALLKSIRGALKPGGTYLMVEVNVSSKLEDNINPMGKLMYSMSTLYCMTTSLAHGGAGIGACMGEAKARELVAAAGFKQFKRLPIDDAFSALYEIQA
ncbi:MAG TPA: methyltransferase domain-containing protein [Candidatus Acidoferrales bacterium]|nr:methyltransferase domain-containing protein [Candidatus Acidoferrales bacterium]